jgi:putative ABC transport system permease protein
LVLELVEKRLNDEIIPKYVATIFDQFDIEIKYEMLNIRDIHLYSDFQGEPQPLGNIEYIYIFSAVAVFLVLIACINYMNLATARSMRRSLEVGIRKVMGAVKSSLMRQFIVESVLIALLAIVLSIAVLAIVIPLINNLLGTQLAFLDLFTLEISLSLVGIMLLTGIVSGSYPAFYLSSFSPIKAIRGGKGAKHSGNVWIRRVLVGIQFAISIFMLIGTFVIYQQMQYVRNADLGFDKDQVIYFSLNDRMSQKWSSFRNKLLENPNIKQAATSSTIPGGGFGKNLMNVETNKGVMESYGIDFYQVDYDYMDVLNIDFADGRNISREFVTDTASAVMVNEAMVSRLGWE